MSYASGASFSNSSSVRTPAMPLPTMTRRLFLAALMSVAFASGHLFDVRLPAIEKLQHFGSIVVILRVLGELDPVARPRQRDSHDSANRGGGTVGHHHDA